MHAFAGGIGLQRRWFQDKKWPHTHYDVTDTMRRAAIAAGAMPVTWQQAGRQMLAARRRTELDMLTVLEVGDSLLYPPTAVLDPHQCIPLRAHAHVEHRAAGDLADA